jgi:hypothetical protein
MKIIGLFFVVFATVAFNKIFGLSEEAMTIGVVVAGCAYAIGVTS